MLLHAAARFLMTGGILVAATGWWMKDVLPDPAKLQFEGLEEPVQKSVRKSPIDTRVNGGAYRDVSFSNTQWAGVAALFLGLVLWLFLPMRVED